MQLHEEGVLHIAGGMLFRKVERGEHVPVILNVGTRDSGETDVLKDAAHLIHHDGDGVHRAQLDVCRRTGNIRDSVERAHGSLHFGFLLLKTLLCLVLQLVEHLSKTLAFLRCNVLDFAEHGLQFTFLAQEIETELLQCLGILNFIIFYFCSYFVNRFHTMMG